MLYQCPYGTFSYIIQSGDTIYTLANQYNTTAEAIYAVNPGINPDDLPVGDAICMPTPCPCRYQASIEQTEGSLYEMDQGLNIPMYQQVDTIDATQRQGPPTSPPPNFTPQLGDLPDQSLMAVDPEAISHCVFRFTYLWLTNGKSFWAFLVQVGRTSASGWRYFNGRWVFFGVDLKEISSFICY